MSMPTYSVGQRCLNFNLSLPLLPYFVYVRSKCSGMTSSSEPYLLADEIITKIMCAGPNDKLSIQLIILISRTRYMSTIKNGLAEKFKVPMTNLFKGSQEN